MSLKVCFKCGTVTRSFTNPFQDLPCNHSDKQYRYSNENQSRLEDKDLEWVNPVDQEGREIKDFRGDKPRIIQKVYKA